MSEGLQRFGLDPILAALFLAFAMVGASALVFVFDHSRRRLAIKTQPGSEKLAPLEGLRGILAFSVVAHHAYCWYFFSQSGVWSTGQSVIFDRLADFGVAQFFYLSGFLFWRKLMRRGHISAGKFYLSRLLRIAPVYYLSIAAALGTGCLVSGFKLQVTPGSLITSLLPWLLFSLGSQAPVNHLDIARITCGVTWTLALEWLFYLSLPSLGWFSRKAARLVFFALVFGILFLLGKYLRTTESGAQSLHTVGFVLAQFSKFMLAGFGGGILVAALQPHLSNWLRSVWAFRNWIVLGVFLAYLAVPGLPAAAQFLLLAGFALIAQGADLFGLLTSRAARFLGAISYPVYLVHGIVFYAAMRPRSGMQSVNLLPYLGETALCLVAILLLASLIHFAVEQPTMKLSEKIARSSQSPAPASLACASPDS